MGVTIISNSKRSWIKDPKATGIESCPCGAHVLYPKQMNWDAAKEALNWAIEHRQHGYQLTD